MGQKAVLLPAPANRLAALVILAPTVIYLTADIMRNGNQWKK